MAGATVTNNEWGYSATGGTDATTVTTGKVQLSGIVCGGTASADTVTVANVAGTILAKVAFTPTLHEEVPLFGARCEGVVITLSATGSICNLIVV